MDDGVDVTEVPLSLCHAFPPLREVLIRQIKPAALLLYQPGTVSFCAGCEGPCSAILNLHASGLTPVVRPNGSTLNRERRVSQLAMSRNR